MTIQQIGALKNIDRPTLPQNIVPGSGRFDYVASGGSGRPMPAVGDYPTGSPRVGYGLAGRLSDGGASWLQGSGLLQVGLALAVAYLGYQVYEGVTEYRRK